MRRFFFVASFVAGFVVLAPAGTVTLKWRAETSQAQSYQATVYRGETARLEAQLLSYGAALALPSNATASIYYQTNGMADAWWVADAAATTNGVVSADFTPEMDAGASRYVFFLGVSGDGANYRANGVLNIRHAPGATPHALALPAPFIDFSTVTVSNSPWATPADVAEAVEAIVEADPVAYPVATTALAVAQERLLPSATNALAAAAAHAATDHRVASSGGFEAGEFANTTGGGGAVGVFAWSVEGGAVGREARTYTGGAVGLGAVTSAGFAGGSNALAMAEGGFGGTPIDAIQLGTGRNYDPRTMQVYDWRLLDDDGRIPLDRMAEATNWVESIRGIHVDIASNVVWHVVVSNGHWLIQEVQ